LHCDDHSCGLYGSVRRHVDLSALGDVSGFAFSFWGGDFYSTDAIEHPSKVSRYRPSDKKLEATYMPSANFVIVGAGVSTCAPTTLPK
jgi:hypothetical protein